MNASRVFTCAFVGLLAASTLAVNIETVPVGDAGNAGELSGAGAGGYGPDRICGSVGYEYRIGKYEVTAGQYCAFLNAIARTDTYGLYNAAMTNTTSGSSITRDGLPGSYTYSIAADFVNRPVNNVSWGDAARFANWLHNGQPTGMQDVSTTEDGAYFLNGAATNAQLLAVQREADWRWAIASEDEWYKAAYYKGGSAEAGYWEYPTRSDTIPGRDLSDFSGNNANYYGTPMPIDPPYFTTVVGEFQNSASPYGTFDQAGNVWEWNESVDGPSRCLRGGSFGYRPHMDASSRDLTYPTYEYYNVGFRVVQIPEPATLVLLSLGCLVALRPSLSGSRSRSFKAAVLPRQIAA
jgi:formylglycine-generating enzyme required for sulfatase activity